MAKAELFFSPAERERIKATVAEVEVRTIGEVAVMVTAASDTYAEAEVLGGALVAGMIALVPTMVWFGGAVWWFVPFTALLFLPARLLFRRVPELKVPFIPAAHREHEVRERALFMFYERGLHRTRQQSAVFFYLSLLERRVHVLADRGIYERIDQPALDRLAELVAQGMREGRACDSLVDAIKEAGELLALHFPPGEDNPQELPDDLLIG